MEGILGLQRDGPVDDPNGIFRIVIAVVVVILLLIIMLIIMAARKVPGPHDHHAVEGNRAGDDPVLALRIAIDDMHLEWRADGGWHRERVGVLIGRAGRPQILLGPEDLLVGRGLGANVESPDETEAQQSQD